MLTGFVVETAVFVKAQWDRRKATGFQRVYHKKGLMLVTVDTDMESVAKFSLFYKALLL